MSLELNIIMPYRPLVTGSLTGVPGPLYQLPDSRWQFPGGEPSFDYREDVVRSVFFLNKNSVFKHKIIVAIDSDVFLNNSCFKEFPNVRIHKSDYKAPIDAANPPYLRICAAYRDAIDTVPDEDWICYGYTSDIICCNRWDLPIYEAIREFGDEYVYVPMFVEMKDGQGYTIGNIKGINPTPEQIWVEFREKICCHGLTWPEPNKNYVTEEDFDRFIAIAKDPKIPPTIIERCGDRTIGYYNVLCMKAKYARMAGFTLQGVGFDIKFDDDLRDKARRKKVVVTRSFVYHPQSETYRIPFLWKAEDLNRIRNL